MDTVDHPNTDHTSDQVPWVLEIIESPWSGGIKIAYRPENRQDHFGSFTLADFRRFRAAVYQVDIAMLLANHKGRKRTAIVGEIESVLSQISNLEDRVAALRAEYARIDRIK